MTPTWMRNAQPNHAAVKTSLLLLHQTNQFEMYVVTWPKLENKLIVFDEQLEQALQCNMEALLQDNQWAAACGIHIVGDNLLCLPGHEPICDGNVTFSWKCLAG